MPVTAQSTVDGGMCGVVTGVRGVQCGVEVAEGGVWQEGRWVLGEACLSVRWRAAGGHQVSAVCEKNKLG